MNHAPASILIIDDIEDVRDGLAIILEDEGYKVITTSNGIKALSTLENNPVDLIITDVLMPEMNGIELITKASLLYPDIKYIVISGGGRATLGDYDSTDSTYNLSNISHILKKPFRPEQLISMVKESLLK